MGIGSFPTAIFIYLYYNSNIYIDLPHKIKCLPQGSPLVNETHFTYIFQNRIYKAISTLRVFVHLFLWSLSYIHFHLSRQYATRSYNTVSTDWFSIAIEITRTYDVEDKDQWFDKLAEQSLIICNMPTSIYYWVGFCKHVQARLCIGCDGYLVYETYCHIWKITRWIRSSTKRTGHRLRRWPALW